MTPKNIHKILIPQKIFNFSKTPKNIEIQNLYPKRWPDPTYVWKYQSTPPPPPLGDYYADFKHPFWHKRTLKDQGEN